MRIGSDEFDLLDKVELVSRRHGHFDLVIGLAPNERAAQRGIVADAPALGICLCLADDLIAHRLLFIVEQRDGCTEHNAIARQGRRVDDVRAADLVFQIGDRCLNLPLAFLAA